MARLNEAPAALESNWDILRRKFQRQNRDLARVNSNQSNRIRTLENECARLLSENLDLRGQVMRLEKELENSSTQRIADHALDIKVKMEAQLAELSSMLASLGSEPPSKRHSPERRKYAKPSPRGLRSPAKRKLKDPGVDQEALAAQEGRLPPIYENKAYPRATMNSEEIMALCAEAADSSHSPDLGPPPVSRFVDGDAVRAPSPAERTEKVEPKKQPDVNQNQPTENSAHIPKLSYQRKAPSNPDTRKDPDLAPTKVAKPTDQPEQPKYAPQVQVATTIRAGAKRKYGDENENVKTAKVVSGKGISNETSEKANAPDVLKTRAIKELPTGKRPVGRPPLSAKSTNDDVTSPKKALREDTKPAKPQSQSKTPPGDVPTRERKPAPIPKLEIPAIQEPNQPVVDILPDLAEPGTPAPPFISPDTPDQPAAGDGVCDTPPPGHLSVDGETSRPSRRARAAISYAEPNLRDKMRRPTKELFDAVSGEGKFKARQSMTALQKGDESAPTSVNRLGSDGPRTTSWPRAESAAAGAKDATRRESVLSPLVLKELQSVDMLPSTVVTERRKRPSAVGIAREPATSPVEEKSSDKENSAPATTNITTSAPANPPRPRTRPEKTIAAMDVYEFASSSPAAPEAKDAAPEEASDKPKRQARRASAAAHQALREYAAAAELSVDEPTHPTTKHRAPGHGRKRASMLAPKKPAVAQLLDYDYHQDYCDKATAAANASPGDGDGESTSAADKISRRNSMML